MSQTEPGGWIGKPMRRREDRRLITGRGCYAGDCRAEGMAHMAVVRAGSAPARIHSLELDGARRSPGVLGVWGARDLALSRETMPDSTRLPPSLPRQPILASSDVRYAGQALAVVVAESEYQAYDALELVYVNLTPPGDSDPTPHQVTIGVGDAEEAFAKAPVVVRERLRMGKVCGLAMEPRAAFAEWDAAREVLTIWASIGDLHSLRAVIADCLGLNHDQVVTRIGDVGGSFGAKNSPYPEYVLAAAVARRLSRPVRWVARRMEDGATTGQAHGAELDLEIAATEEGELIGIRGHMTQDVGAFHGVGALQAQNYVSHLVSGYRLPVVQVQVEDRCSLGPPASYIRGGGRPVANFAIERLMDRLARRLGLEPAELRRRNLIRPSEMPFATGLPNQTYDGGDYPRLLELALEGIGYRSAAERQAAGEPVGVGLAFCVESTGIGVPEQSRVSILPDGTVQVTIGSAPQGQGHETFVTQMVAERLGWDPNRIAVLVGDSRGVQHSSITAGSRSALEVGNSVAMSAASARRTLLERAARFFEADPADIEFDLASGAAVRGVPGRRVTLSQLVGSGLEASEIWNSGGVKAWAASCHAARVRIDVETGTIEVLRYLIAHDSGRVINPLTLNGQLHGGYAHGLGFAVFEEAVYGDDGSFLTPSLLDYLVPGIHEIAGRLDLVHTETPSLQNPEGIRGAGEVGTIAVPAAIANAVEDALHRLGRHVAIREVPITPPRLLDLLQISPSRPE